MAYARVDIELFGRCELRALPSEMTVEARTRGFPVITRTAGSA